MFRINMSRLMQDQVGYWNLIFFLNYIAKIEVGVDLTNLSVVCMIELWIMFIYSLLGRDNGNGINGGDLKIIGSERATTHLPTQHYFGIRGGYYYDFVIVLML